MATATIQTCYRHPSRETGVSCSSCGRPICPDCMTPTAVGMRCPECSKQRTKVHKLRSTTTEPRVTYAIIALCVIAFLGSGSFGARSGGGELYQRGALLGTLVADGDYWRLVTSGFLHSGFIHILFNMYLLYILGSMLEPLYGSVRFGVLYFTALLCGSLGALLQTADTPTVGASGAVFGLMGAAFMEMRRRGVDPMQTDIGGLIVINLIISFLPGFNISWGGHIGGLVGGALAALALHQADRLRRPWVGVAACAVLAAGAVAASLAVVG